jgi:chemotaxis protein CheD
VTQPPIFVRVAHAEVTEGEGILATVGLGSCVAILLYDPLPTVAGMAHVLLPAPHREFDGVQPAKYATTAVPYLLQEMATRGARRSRVTARLVGGASMFGGARTSSLGAAGERNLQAVRDALDWAGIPVTGEEVGQAYGRSVRMHASDGRVVVSSYLRPDVIL